MWKNILEQGRQVQMAWRMRVACWIPKAADTLRLGNTHCFSTARMVVRTRLIVTLYVHCLSCSVSAVQCRRELRLRLDDWVRSRKVTNFCPHRLC
jgi:hypothetical protein